MNEGAPNFSTAKKTRDELNAQGSNFVKGVCGGPDRTSRVCVHLCSRTSPNTRFRNQSVAPGRKQRHCGKVHLTTKGGIYIVIWIVIAAASVIIALFLYLRFRAAKKIENNIAF